MNFLTNDVFLDESAFDRNMKRSRAWSQKKVLLLYGLLREQTQRLYRDAISVAGLIAVGVEKKPRPTKKRKADGHVSSGTVTGHYISFLKMTLDEMDKHPHMKGRSMVMDNPLPFTGMKT